MADDRPIPAPTTRRTLLASGLAIGLGAVLAACGSDAGDGASPSTRAADGAPTTASASSTAPAGVRSTAATSGGAAGSSPSTDGFPLTISHRYGSTTIPAAPTRVVTAGFNDADFALAVGVVPVGVADFIGTFDENSRPWAQAALGDAEPEVVTSDAGQLQFERIAALDPDVIVYYSYLEEADYANLARIAPTVVEPQAGTLWRRHTLDVGRALGRTAEAQAMVDQVEQRFAAARDAHPEFAGTTAALLFGADGSGTNYFLLEPTDPRIGLFDSLGFEMPATTGDVSREQVELLDQDLIVVIGTEREVLEADPLFSSLNAVTEGRVVYLGGFDDQFAGALGFDSPLSLPAALDIAVPQLAAALTNR